MGFFSTWVGGRFNREIANINANMNERVAVIQQEAANYGADMSYAAAARQAVAQEISATLNKEGIIAVADRQAAAQELTAILQKEGLVESADRYAVAQEFSALESANAQRFAAKMGKEGQVLSAKEYAQAQVVSAKEAAAAQRYSAFEMAGAQRFSAERSARAQEYTAQQQAGAQRFTAERGARAQEYSAREYAGAQRFTAERQSRAQEYTAKQQAGAQRFTASEQKEATIASSGISSASNVVASGFTNLNAGQRALGQWAMARSPDTRTLGRNYIYAMGLFLLGMAVLFLAMDIFGIPVLQSLANITAEAGARAVALVDALKEGTPEATDAFADTSTTMAASIGGMLTALFAKFQDVLDALVDWLGEAYATLTEQISGYLEG